MMRGEFVVIQNIGGGRWVVVVGANTEEAARRKAALYPGETRTVTNAPGADAFPGVML